MRLITWHYNQQNAPRGATPERVEAAIYDAAGRWNRTGKVRIIPGPNAMTSTIEIRWCDNSHRNALGTYSPKTGVIWLDYKTRWGWTWLGRIFGADLASVVTHEFGHALSVEHSTDARSIMFPEYNRRGVIMPEDAEQVE